MIGFEWDTSLLFAFVASVLLAAFSIGVGVLARFQGPAKWYALFGGTFGATAGLGNLREGFLAWVGTTYGTFEAIPASAFMIDAGLNGARVPLAVLWLFATVRLLQCYGAPRAWPTAAVAASVGLATVVPGMMEIARSEVLWTLPTATQTAVVVDALVGFFVLAAIAVMASAGWLMARARLESPQSGQAILAAALMAYPLAFPVWTAAHSAEAGSPAVWYGLIGLLGFIAMVVGWLQVREHQGGKNAWAVIGVGVLFFAGSFFLGIFNGARWSPSSLARSFDVVLVAYAILRLQYLGLDVKVRWGISKTTVAAAFIAVFFVGSEAAQVFFGDRLGGEYFGIAAAGLLVFAIAPLQRLADRMALSAVPDVNQRATDAEAIYAEAVLAARRDGIITKREEVHLAAIADKLKLSSTRALELRENPDSS